MSGSRRSVSGSHGFTIVELMIATLVFSMVLMVITYGVLRFTHDYYQGVNSSTTQGIARNVTDTISQSIQFSGQTPSSQPGYLCAGNTEFAYNLGYIVGSGSSYALVQFPTGGGCPAPGPGASGWGDRKELLQPRMELTKFSVTNTGGAGLWAVRIELALGERDLLCVNNLPGAGNCSSSTPPTQAQLANPTAVVHCHPDSGAAQFCDVAGLSTVAQMRVNN